MKKKRLQNKRQTRSFDPDLIVTKIDQAVRRDMSAVTDVYGISHPIGRLAFDQSSRLLKKYSSPSLSQDDLVDKTFKKFLSVNEHMRDYSGANFCPPTARVILSSTPKLEAILIVARALMHNILTDFDEEEWFSMAQHGPGATVGVKYKDTSVEAKLTFPISLTARVAPLMDRYLAYNFQLRAAVEEFNRENPLSGRYTFVTGSQATTVEKNTDIRRFISKEPTGNMFFQQGLMGMMYRRMEVFGLDVRVLPDQHKVRAMISSITSQEATIDWSSASDCNSRELLKWLMPPKWFSVADMVRSTCTNINGTDVELNMFSTMGNAVTFPLETLVFYTLGHALIHLNTGNRSRFLNWDHNYGAISVFGDDCIVPSEIAEEYIHVLTQVGFLINSEKSFYRPQDVGFRESCGGDYLHGYDVRPYSLKAPHSVAYSSLEPWLYIIGNRLTQKYKTCFGLLSYVYDKQLFRTLERLFVEHNIEVKLVPDDFPDDAGLKMSDDVQRLALHYPKLRFSEIKCSKHGTYSFLYSRFIYRKDREREDIIHFPLALQRPGKKVRLLKLETDEDKPIFRNEKRKGGYVVARGISCHWHVPRLL